MLRQVLEQRITASAAAVDLAAAVFFLPAPKAGLLYSLNPAAWSLLFEIVANAWLAFFIGRPLATGATVALAAIATIAATAASGAPGYRGGYDWSTLWSGTIRIGLAFPVGILVYRAWQIRKPTIRVPAPIVGLALVAILFAPAASAAFDIVVVLLLPLVLWPGASSAPQSWIARVCSWLGAISYAVYILHEPIFRWVIGLIGALSGQVVPLWLTGVLCIGAAVTVATAADAVFDSAARRFLASLIAGPKSSSQSTESTPPSLLTRADEVIE